MCRPVLLLLHLFILLLPCAAQTMAAVEYPAGPPGKAEGSAGGDSLSLYNSSIRCKWTLDGGRCVSLEIANLHSGRMIHIAAGCMPRVVLAGGAIIDLAKIEPDAPFALESFGGDESSARLEERFGGKRLRTAFRHEDSDLQIDWSAELRDGSSYVVEKIELCAERETAVESLRFLDAPIAGAELVGEVSGSVVVCDGIFLAAEHPLATNSVDEASRVRCELPRGNTLGPGRPWRFSAVIGAVPEGQLRRGFLYYLERRRAHPHRPFLHDNSWYHLNIALPDHRMTEAECLQAIEDIGRELVAERDVVLDAFVWDDGWDDFSSLWGFHDGFPRGFEPLARAARKYGAALGVWMCPGADTGSLTRSAPLLENRRATRPTRGASPWPGRATTKPSAPHAWR